MAVTNSKSLDEETVNLIRSTATENGLHNITFENVAVNIGKGENYLSLLERIKVLGEKDNGEQGELNLFIKNPLSDPEARKSIKSDILFQKEIFAYTRLLPTYAELQKEVSIPEEEKIKHPKLYKVAQKNGYDVIILEDMRPAGFMMRSRHEPMDYAHARIIIKSLAKFHALSFVLEKRQPDLFSEYAGIAKDHFFPQEKDEKHANLQKMFKAKTLGVVDNPEHRKKLDLFFDVMSDKIAEAVQPQKFSVLCHGDFWTNNMLFKYKDGVPLELSFIDFQIIRYANPVTDLLYFICCCTDQDLRTKHLEELLELYHDTLSKSLKAFAIDADEVYPHSVFFEDFKKYSGFGIAMAIFLTAIFLSDSEDAPDICDLMDSTKELKAFNSNTNGYTLYVKKISELIEDAVQYKWL